MFKSTIDVLKLHKNIEKTYISGKVSRLLSKPAFVFKIVM